MNPREEIILTADAAGWNIKAGVDVRGPYLSMHPEWNTSDERIFVRFDDRITRVVSAQRRVGGVSHDVPGDVPGLLGLLKGAK